MLKMFPFLFILTCLPLFETFLIDNTTKPPQNGGLSLTDSHYYRLLDMLNEEIHLRRQLEQYVADLKLTYEQTLPLNINETQVLKNENVELKRELGTLKSDIKTLKVQTERMEYEINTLKRLETFQQLDIISTLVNKSSNMEETIHKIDVKLNQVALENDARSNKSLTTDLSLIQKLQKMEFSQQLLNQSLNAFDTKTETEIQNIMTDLHTTEAKMKMSMEIVSISACSKGQTVNTNDSLIFADNLETNGIPNHGVYNNGVFECKLRGLYLIFVSIVSNNEYAHSFIYKNDKKISTVYVTTGSSHDFQSGSGMAVVELVPGDRLYVRAHYSFGVGSMSCFSLAKII